MIEGLPVVNAGYENGMVWTLLSNGDVAKFDVSEFGYPYFYASNNLSSRSEVVATTRETIKVLKKDRIVEGVFFKTFCRRPEDVYSLSYLAGHAVEADIKYIERRLGADGVFKWTIPERIAGVDIETDKDLNIVLIGMIEVENGKRKPYRAFTNAEEFEQYIEENKIACSVAWNGSRFDDLIITRDAKTDYWSKVLKLDGMDIYAKRMQKTTRALNIVGREEKLGGKFDLEGENVADLGERAKNGERGAWKKLLDYNRRDVVLMLDILDKHGLIENEFGLSEITGVHPLELTEIPMLEGFIMSNRDEFGVYLDKKPERVKDKKLVKGGAVWGSGKHGILKNAAVVDFKSLYPSAVMFIDVDDPRIKVIWDMFKRIMEVFVGKKTEYGELHKQTKNPRYKLLRFVFKILANGSYGVFQSEYFRYYDPDIANLITEKAREKRQELHNYIEAAGLTPFYSDTDSLFFFATEEQAEKITKEINEKFAPFEVDFEYYFPQIFFFADKMGNTIKKRYFGYTSEGVRIVRGVEAIRSDWSWFIRNMQNLAIEVISHSDTNEIAYLRLSKLYDFALAKLRSRNIPIAHLVITKGLRIGENDYNKTNLPHARAARLIQGHPTGWLNLRAHEEFKFTFDENQLPLVFVSYIFVKKNKKTDIQIMERWSEEDESYIDWGYYTQSQFKNVFDRMMVNVKPPEKTLMDFGKVKK